MPYSGSELLPEIEKMLSELRVDLSNESSEICEDDSFDTPSNYIASKDNTHLEIA